LSEIDSKQKRTIDLFSEGVQLNNQALSNREKHINLMLEVERTSDRLRRDQLTRQADGFYRISEECSNSARDRFAAARQQTDSVRVLQAAAIALRSQYGVVGHQSQLASASGGQQSAIGGQQSIVGAEPSQPAYRNSQPSAQQLQSPTLQYTVQVGVYRSAVPPVRIAILPKLRSEQLNNEVYRYSTGVFDTRQQADSMRKLVVKAGMKDAFVTIVRGGSAVVVPDRTDLEAHRQSLPVQPVNPGVLTYRIQLGAFKGKIPYSAVEGFVRIFEKGIDREVNDAGFQVFYSGNYTTYEKAVVARDEAIAKGVKDAFIVALQNGKRVSITRAILSEGR
jgi:hypothetical protein